MMTERCQVGLLRSAILGRALANPRLLYGIGSSANLTRTTSSSTKSTMYRQLARYTGTVKLPTGLGEMSAVRWGVFEVSSWRGLAADDDMTLSGWASSKRRPRESSRQNPGLQYGNGSSANLTGRTHRSGGVGRLIRLLARGLLETVGGLARRISRLPDRICGRILPALETSGSHRGPRPGGGRLAPWPGREADEREDRKAAKHGHTGGAASGASDAEEGAVRLTVADQLRGHLVVGVRHPWARHVREMGVAACLEGESSPFENVVPLRRPAGAGPAAPGESRGAGRGQCFLENFVPSQRTCDGRVGGPRAHATGGRGGTKLSDRGSEVSFERWRAPE